MKYRSIRRIIWAVDVFWEDSKLHRSAISALRALADRTQCEIEPVFVLSPAQLNLSLEFSPPWIQQYRPAAERALASFVSRLKIPGLIKPHLIVHNAPSTTQAVKALSQYAQMVGADAILASTHGRKGIGRFFLGSFSEALLINSRVPVFTVNPKLKMSGALDHVLFPTDFGHGAKYAFKRVVALAANLKANLTLYHAIRYPIEPVFQSGIYLLGGAWVPVHAYFDIEVERKYRHSEGWADWAHKQGVNTDIVIRTEGGNISDTILELAKKKNVGLIAMEAQSGPITAAIVGSITRQVVRGAECGVWAFRESEAEAKSAQVQAQQKKAA